VGKIRVLVVDDAVVVRKLLTSVLAEDAQIEIAGTAPDGRIALEKIRQLNPDVVILDIEMPVMDGLETLSALRKTHPSLPVIMFSTLTERGAAMTLEALSRGATDYVTKPGQSGGLEDSVAYIRREVLPKIRALCGVRAGAIEPGVRQARRSAGRAAPVEVVVVGVSTGGPNALSQLVPALGAELGVPILIVQHMPAMFTRLLAQRLSALGPLRVEEGFDGAPLEPGRAYVAPGGRHMKVRREGSRRVVQLSDAPEENSCRPSVDVLLRSVASLCGANALAVILTGMGEDGLRGCELIAEAGGSAIAQDKASSVVWGMPGAIVRAGLADEVLPLGEIGAAIARKVAASKTSARPPARPAESIRAAGVEEAQQKKIPPAGVRLRRRSPDASGYDFVRKLVHARCGMVLDAGKNYLVDARLEPVVREEGHASLAELVEQLSMQSTGRLAARVVEAMMVHETSFFRDGHPFDTLRDAVVPALIRARQPSRSLAIWCAAGASGQEAYSIGMTLLHAFPELAAWDVQIHVSDISQRMLEITREGRYGSLEVSRGLPDGMLERFFMPDGDGWRVREVLRRMIRAFPVNLIGPWPALPPIDVVLLRNVLIYFDVVQKRSILERVAGVLRPDGVLFLGATETTLQITERWEPVRAGKTLYYKLKE
jgi:two-component system, chemotaxis family, protein-glutamate methylesterase/glutaminase